MLSEDEGQEALKEQADRIRVLVERAQRLNPTENVDGARRRNVMAH